MMDDIIRLMIYLHTGVDIVQLKETEDGRPDTEC